MLARLSEDGSTVILGGETAGDWEGRFPVSALAAQLRFYRGLRDRKGGHYAAFYSPTVAALEAVARDLARKGA